MIRKKQENYGPYVIDLTGPQGNAFVLLGYANNLLDNCNLMMN